MILVLGKRQEMFTAILYIYITYIYYDIGLDDIAIESLIRISNGENR